MAAQPSAGPELVDLRYVRSLDLAPLLAEETEHWRACLNWDFERSADLVRRFTDLRALDGSALISSRGHVIGYCYSITEDGKGLIGDLFLSRDFRTPENECLLLAPVLKHLLSAPVRRIESQLMMFDASPAFQRRLRGLPAGQHVRVFERDFMLLNLQAGLPSEQRVGRDITFVPWSSVMQDSAAHMIAEAYRGHIDSQINDQYRSLAGARKFLYNIVQYPGCGVFHLGASLAAVETATGVICGLCLTSMVSEGAGHVTQLCVSPKMQGRGVGYALLSRSLRLLQEQNCRSASLTVTSSNQEALRLYLRAGFRSLHHFPACVWESNANSAELR